MLGTPPPVAGFVAIAAFVGQQHLYFYDAVSPVVEADTIDHSRTFRASRYGKGGDDYVNCPLTEEEYRAFFAALTTAESAEIKAFDSQDGIALQWLRRVGIQAGVISGRVSVATAERAKSAGFA